MTTVWKAHTTRASRVELCSSIHFLNARRGKLRMKVSELIEVLLADQQRVWKEGPPPDVLRAVASGVHDSDGQPIEHWCLVTAACHASKKGAFHPGEYKEAATSLGLNQADAKATSMFGDGLLSRAHESYVPLSKLRFALLTRGAKM